MTDSPKHVIWRDVEPAPLFDLGERATYKALTGKTAQIMRVEMKAGVHFPNPDDPAELETHPNEQISTVLSGRMRIVIDGVERVVGPGETIAIPPGAPHVAEFLEDTEMLEVFVPPIM
ncbi:cupin domain-containing protein [Amycolatopsis pithecellobii]|uniref:Cupin domain-containing protein n=1 Tax=Amycolatopsis pithecellobii TaxID=664692 RepID=A0A6N7YZN9_9PSEU|nr:cupin domain-containing protein [Amycolatopsis pithecellobii]MTD52564.1 cupin domain-containing protein [Amycolatopsis pithecellobii]